MFAEFQVGFIKMLFKKACITVVMEVVLTGEMQEEVVEVVAL
jgi:hypothetical protein